MQAEDVKLFRETETSTHTDAPYALKLTLTSNVAINPVRFAIYFNAPVKHLEVKYCSEFAFFGDDKILESNPREVILNINASGQPILRPDCPITLHVDGERELIAEKIQRGPR